MTERHRVIHCDGHFILAVVRFVVPLAMYSFRINKKLARPISYSFRFTSEEHQEALLSEPLPAALRNDENDLSRAVMTTWALTVQKIEQESPL